MVALKEELEGNEASDAEERAKVQLIAHGWEKMLGAPRKIREFNELPEEEIARKTGLRFAQWVVEARTANRAPWASMEELIEDIRRRFALKHGYRNRFEPLPVDWKDQLDTAVVKIGRAKTKYRPADELLFPEEL